MITVQLSSYLPDDAGLWRAALQAAHDIIMSETANDSGEFMPERELAEALRQAGLALACPGCKDRGWLVVAVDGNENNQRIERCDLCAAFLPALFAGDDTAIRKATAWVMEHGYEVRPTTRRAKMQAQLVRRNDGQLISLWPTAEAAVAAGVNLIERTQEVQ